MTRDKLKFPIIGAVVLIALAAGLYVSGVVGGGGETGPVKKHVIEPVPMAEDFIVNVKDGDRSAYLVVGLALKLEPMDEEHYLAFTGAGGGGHGGPAEAPGPPKIAAYPPFRDAVLRVGSTFSASELKTDEGKTAFKEQLLEEFAAVAEADTAAAKASAPVPHGTVAPPYHVMDVTFTKFVVQ